MMYLTLYMMNHIKETSTNYIGKQQQNLNKTQLVLFYVILFHA